MFQQNMGKFMRDIAALSRNTVPVIVKDYFLLPSAGHRNRRERSRIGVDQLSDMDATGCGKTRQGNNSNCQILG